MKRVIKMSKAWIAALCIGVILTGCGGGSSGGSADSGDSVKTGSQSSDGSTAAGVVGDYGDRTAALSWNAPMTRVNNDSIAMGELSGYIIRYGQDPANLTELVRIDSADTMEYTVTNLDNGTWYFSIQVEDVDGLVSAPSEPVSKTIQG